MGGDFDQLVFRLLIGLRVIIPLADFLDEEALVAVLLAIDRSYQETVAEGENSSFDYYPISSYASWNQSMNRPLAFWIVTCISDVLQSTMST